MPGMAIIVGQEVALTMLAANAPYNRRGNVLFGIAIDAANGLIDVLWENGLRTDDIPEDQLDVIANGLIGNSGQVVRPYNVPAQSAEYFGTVARSYTRQVAGAGATPSFVLVRTKLGQMIESPAADVTPVPGQ